MIIDSKERAAFSAYLSPLEHLEKSLLSTGMEIEFRLGIFEAGKRYVQFLHRGKPSGVQFIEGDSPAQAVKDVAAAVKCDWMERPVAAAQGQGETV